jgi:hypothetical protein
MTGYWIFCGFATLVFLTMMVAAYIGHREDMQELVSSAPKPKVSSAPKPKAYSDGEESEAGSTQACHGPEIGPEEAGTESRAAQAGDQGTEQACHGPEIGPEEGGQEGREEEGIREAAGPGRHQQPHA